MFDEAYAELFIGRIPPFLMFDMEYQSLWHLVASHENDQLFEKRNHATEVALIGLVAHFEAFCKHQFAAIINICPELLNRFISIRNQSTLPVTNILSIIGDVQNKLGFIMAEQYDFGSPKGVNSLFFDLLKVTPISRDEASKFNNILQQRNLLTHHAGYYTLESLKRNSPKDVANKAFIKQVEITTEKFYEIWDFMFFLAIGLTQTTTKALRRLLIETSDGQDKLEASEQLLFALYDILNIEDDINL